MKLYNMSPLQQLRAGRLPLRLVNLVIGLLLFALAMALIIRAGLGADPWDVLNIGVANHIDLSLGTIAIIISAIVLLLWIPLKLWPGLGTVLNALLIGLGLDFFLSIIPEIHGLGWQILVLAAAILINGLGGAMYIGTHFGAGPRDGLMTGLHHRTGKSVRLIRTCIEVAVLLIGWALGGPVGIGTIAYALLIGPSTQLFFRYTIISLPAASSSTEASSTAP